MIEKIQIYLRGMGITHPNTIIFTVASVLSTIDIASIMKILNLLKNNDDKKTLYKKICEHIPKEIRDVIKEFIDFQNIPKEIFEDVFGELLNFDTEDLIEIVENIDVHDDIKDFRISDSKSINQLVINLLETSNGKSLLNADCGTGKFILQSCEENLAEYIQGCSLDVEDFYITAIRSYLKDAMIWVNRKPYFGLLYSSKYDMIYASYPFVPVYDMGDVSPILEKLNIKFSSKRTIRSINMIATLNLLENLNENGMLVSIVPEGSLFNLLDIDFRKFMVDNNYLDAIISLPPGLLAPYTNVKTSLLILKKDRNISDSVYMIDATEICEKLRRGLTFSDENINEIVSIYAEKSGISITKEEIVDNNYYLGVERYKKVNTNLINPIPLNQVSKTIFRGYQIKASELDELVTDDAEGTKYRVVNISDIHAEGFVDKKLTPIIVNDEKKFEKYCLEDGDIIITAKNSTVKTAVYRQYGDTKAILTGNLIAIRLNKEIVLPYYLKTFLDSKVGQAEIKSIQTGTTIISITPNNLKEINISFLPLSEQRKLADMFKEKTEEIIGLLEKYETTKEELANLYDNMMN